MVKFSVVAVACAAAMACASQAAAALVTVKYSGLASGYDSGAFGTDRIVTDEPFSVEWRFNETNDPGDPGLFLGATVTLSGVDFVLPGDPAMRAAEFVTPGYGRVTTGLWIITSPPGVRGHTYLTLGNAIASDATPAARDVAYSGTGFNVPEMGPNFNRLNIETTGRFADAGLRFDTTGINVTVVDAPPPPPGTTVPARIRGVPEPSTWAFMLVGFGLAGTALRRRWVRGREVELG